MSSPSSPLPPETPEVAVVSSPGGVTEHGFHTKPTPKTKRGLVASVVMISVVVHLVAIAIFAAIKVAQAIMEEPVFEAPPKVQMADMIKKEIKKKVEQRSRSGGAPPKTVITVERQTDFQIPKVDVKVNNPKGKLGSRGEGDGIGDGVGNGFGNGIGNGFKGFNIRGVEITANRLGVILDVSNSIKPFVPKLRKEIKEGFPEAVVQEIFGCWFTLKPPPRKPNLPPLETAYLTAVELIKKDGCDAIYWFSDLNDSVDVEAIEKFGTLVRMNKVRFYIISVGKEPHPLLASIARKSGGTVKVDKPPAKK